MLNPGNEQEEIDDNAMSNDSSEMEEEEECRVCRGPAEEG